MPNPGWSIPKKVPKNSKKLKNLKNVILTSFLSKSNWDKPKKKKKKKKKISFGLPFPLDLGWSVRKKIQKK